MSTSIESAAQERAARESIELRVRRLLGELFQVHVDQIAPATTFEELGADSADFVELQILLLEEFALEIPERSAHAIRAVEELVSFLHKNLSASQ